MKSERQAKIIRELQARGIASVADLGMSFGVTEITIRRDLEELKQAGKIERVQGGARLIKPAFPEPPVVQRQMEQIDEKRDIARKALDFIPDGCVIALESGSTTFALAEEIANKEWSQLQVITNNFMIQNVLSRSEHVRLIFIGGVIDNAEMCTYGDLAESSLRRLHVQKYFCGCRGIDPHFGRSNDISTGFEMGTVQALSEISDQIILLADHTKFNHCFSVQLMPPEKIDTIITSSLTPDTVLLPYEELGIKVVKA
ncbi:MAG: DeoR/GlpR transcriptional regulator [Anaerolineae bacterium]|nr:DeoR/GlpR transcriptional regulator [Anaerolineae bacterium]